MNEAYIVTPIEVSQLVAKTAEMVAGGYRLVQIGCTALANGYEVTYSFDKDYVLINLRLTVAVGAEIPSISTLYWCAFTYENEIHDLFGITIPNIAIDFKGTFYRTTHKAAFACAPVKEAL